MIPNSNKHEPSRLRELLLELKGAGVSQAQVARSLGIPLRTLVDWLDPKFPTRTMPYSVQFALESWVKSVRRKAA